MAAKPQTVLVVEDEASIASFVAAYLKNAGYAVRTTASGNEALKLVDSEKPALVVLDLMLPDIDGGAKSLPAEVTGPGVTRKDSAISDTATVWSGGPDGFKFRAVGGTYTILVYGTGVNLVAVGTGFVQLAGMPDWGKGDGRFSLNGDPFHSLPGTQTKQLVIGSNG
jgi:hypothetical protein